mgnify:FL=1|jgi:hypothetical protein
MKNKYNFFKLLLCSTLSTLILCGTCMTHISANSIEQENTNTAVISSDEIIVETSPDLKQLAKDMNLNVVTFEKVVELNTISTYSNSNNKSYEKTVENYFLTDEQAARLAQSSTQQQYIFTYAATAYATITYDTYIGKDSITYGRLTSASGGVTDLDMGWQIKNQKVTLGTFGAYDGNPLTQQLVTYNTDYLKWGKYIAPSSWKYVNMQGYHNVGIANTITAKHGSQIYNAQFNCQV